jgi:hypothetical protein
MSDHESVMEEEQIVEAIKKARKGITQYLEIMELFPEVNVVDNNDFQRKFNALYRVRQRSREWYLAYFSFMEGHKGSRPTFGDVLDDLYKSTGRYEPSFSSKLVATLDPEQPIWDVWVLTNTGIRVPSYASESKVEHAKAAYVAIQGWYRQFLNSKDGELVLRVFDRIVPEHARVTDLKKVDFVLWQTRAT